MDIALTSLWILVGWCGTPPRPWPWPWPTGPVGPTPDPWFIKIIGVIGGLAGGYLVHTAFGGTPVEGGVTITHALSTVGAFVGSYLLGDIYSFARGFARR